MTTEPNEPKPKRMRLTANPLAHIGQLAGYRRVRDRAEALQVSASYLSEVERGRTMPSADLVDRMADKYERTPTQVERAARLGRENLSRRILEQTRGML